MSRLCFLIVTMLAVMPPAHAAFLDCLFIDGMDGELGTAPTAWQGNLAVHNCARRTALPAPNPPMPLMKWNATAATHAQNWANQCQWSHDPQLGSHQEGQNMAASAPWTTNVTQAASGWAAEFTHYNYNANTCASGQMCGHYTQMVWRASTGMGCGVNNCSTGSPRGTQFPNWTLVVCNYSPPGNYIGQRPY